MANTIWIQKRKRRKDERHESRGTPGRSGPAAEELQRQREEAERALARTMRERAEDSKAEPVRKHPFSAEIDLTELDSRFRPGLSWSGRAVEISRSHVAFRSRRMCYEERRILLAVHLIDATPVALYGEVVGCDYDGEGLYRTELALMCVPELDVISDWIASHAARGTM